MNKTGKILFVVVFQLLVVNPVFPRILTGKIIDAETKAPVESVYIKNKNMPESHTVSNENGSFSISANLNDTIELYRLGYELKNIILKNTESIVIEMNPIVYSLDEVTISPEDANKIYTKALYNLMAKYSKEPSVYLWHGMEIMNDTAKKESFAEYLASVKSKKSKKNLDFDLRLMYLNHVTTDKFLSIGLLYHQFYDKSSISAFNVRSIKMNSDDDSLIYLKNTVTDNKNKTSYSADIIINQSDTVILYYASNMESFQTDAKLLDEKVGMDVINQYKMLFKKTEEKYILDEKIMVSNISFIFESKKKTKFTIESKTKFLNNDDSGLKSNKLKKLDGQTSQFYKLQPVTIEEF